MNKRKVVAQIDAEMDECIADHMTEIERNRMMARWAMMNAGAK